MSDQSKGSLYPENRRFSFTDEEKNTLNWWRENKIFERSISSRAGQDAFTFYEGPPTANGHPGIHHVMARTIKDLFCRYKTLKGFQVERKAGWDTHGLPVEIQVEKELGLVSRDQVEEFGIEKYNAACKESVQKYKGLWDTLTEQMGYWVDQENPYITFDVKYMETLWWLLKQMYDKDHLYEGHKVLWYSPGSGTVLSSHEVSLGYKDVQDPSIYVRFAVEGQENTFFMIWTTTPWTIPSNTAVAVGKKIDYVKVRHEDPKNGEEFVIVAEARLSIFKDEPVEIVERYTGEELIGVKYHPVFKEFEGEEGAENAWRVVPADFVSTSDGTGIVHMAPAYGADDNLIGKKENLPLFNPVDRHGCFTEQMPMVEGVWFKDADKTLLRHMKELGAIYRHETIVHSYPHDWRKGTPLMSYPVESWFIRTSSIKERMVELNKTINWQPEAIGRGRFGEWLENNVDWALSRRRYWGTPLPIWKSDVEDSEYMEFIGSIAELRAKCGDQIPANDEDVDLHRPHVDKLTWPSPDGGTMRRIPDLIDVWFDSGAMPFAQWHYPFENKEKFEANFPADFIAEGVDQTRGWFYTLHAIASLVMDSVAYKNVISNGLLSDENGIKMSKSLGNIVNPFEAIEKHGADAVRWYMMTTPPWENLKWSERNLEDVKRKFFGTLSNTYLFFATYANIDGFDAGVAKIPLADRSELDRWILSYLNSTIKLVDEAYDDYHPTRATRGVEQFLGGLSNWYVRRSRRRFWRSDSDTDKVAAYQTLSECLEAITVMMSPIAPFYAEWLWKALAASSGLKNRVESVHLADFPIANESAIDTGLEHRMALAQTISSLVLGIRNNQSINVRQPLSRIMVVTGAQVSEDDVKQVEGIICEEVNIRKIEFLSNASNIVSRSVKANFKTLGRRLGKRMKQVAGAIGQMTPAEVDSFLADNKIVLSFPDGDVELGQEDIVVRSEGIEGWEVAQQDTVTVALDIAIDDDLRAEGYAREFVNRVQNMRKGADFEVTDRIKIQVKATASLAGALQNHNETIRNETLAVEFEVCADPAGTAMESFELGEEAMTIAISKN